MIIILFNFKTRCNNLRKSLEDTKKHTQSDNAAFIAQIENLKKTATANHAKLSGEIETFMKSLTTSEIQRNKVTNNLKVTQKLTAEHHTNPTAEIQRLKKDAKADHDCFY